MVRLTLLNDRNAHDPSLESTLRQISQEEKGFGELAVRDVVCRVGVSLLQVYLLDEVEVEFEVGEFDERFVRRGSRLSRLKVLVDPSVLTRPVAVFANEGNCYAGTVRSDLQLVFAVSKPPDFDFKGHDLFLRKDITLKEALLKSSVRVENIDGKAENVLLEEIAKPSTVVKVPGLGFVKNAKLAANRHSRFARGDLYVTFDIKFPDFLSFEQKEVVARVLRQSEES